MRWGRAAAVAAIFTSATVQPLASTPPPSPPNPLVGALRCPRRNFGASRVPRARRGAAPDAPPVGSAACPQDCVKVGQCSSTFSAIVEQPLGHTCLSEDPDTRSSRRPPACLL